MSEYRINVRFNLGNERQRNAAEFLEHLDRKKFGSRNAFAMTAICAYVEELQNGNPNARLLEDIRQIFREEVPAIPAAPAEPPRIKPLDATLTREQQEKQAAATLAFLKGF